VQVRFNLNLPKYPPPSPQLSGGVRNDTQQILKLIARLTKPSTCLGVLRGFFRNEEKAYVGSVDCAKRILDEEGWQALYRLVGTTLLGTLLTPVRI
jgi:hypothetical protein